jgi:AraC-like DNA-binding protein
MAKLFALSFFIATAGRRLLRRPNIRAGLSTIFFAFTAFACSINASRADEGGVAFWFPGLYGSLAAVPLVPGWSIGFVDIYNSVSASGNVAAAREITINGIKGPVNVNLNLNLKAPPNLILADPTYVFATPVLGGQLAVSLAGATGRSIAGLNGTLTVSALGATATKQGAIEDARDGFSDLYPEASLRWHNGVNNWMVYGMGDIPIGTYDSTRLANFGIKTNRSSFGIAVENAIVVLLPHGQAQMSVIARKLGISRRTLARRLASEGLTFAGVLDALRCDLAKRHLADRNLSISKVAWLIRYSDVSAFSNAFKRWTGMSPGTIRQQHSKPKIKS